MDKDVEVLAVELKAEILKAESALRKLELDLGLMQTGSKGMPFWNGENAYHFVRNCTGHFDHDHVLLENLNKCSDYVSQIVQK